MYPIGDFLIQIKNAYMARKKQIEFPYSNAAVAIGKILEKEGYIKKIKNQKSKIKNGRDSILVELKYEGRTPALSEIKLISRPSVHHYVGKSQIKKAVPTHAVGILSTNRGMMTSKQAQKEGLGGELICQIY